MHDLEPLTKLTHLYLQNNLIERIEAGRSLTTNIPPTWSLLSLSARMH
jgi:hypothetical protein